MALKILLVLLVNIFKLDEFLLKKRKAQAHTGVERVCNYLLVLSKINRNKRDCMGLCLMTRTI